MKKLAVLTLALMLLVSTLSGVFAETDKTYTLEEMLQYAYQDEINAEAFYNALMAKFGTANPAQNIVRAEERHVELIKALYSSLNIAMPDFTAAEVALPDTIEEAYREEVKAEMDNIALYDNFLEQEDLPDNVEFVFEKLKAASERHLSAYERALSRGTAGTGLGRGNTQGKHIYGNNKAQGNQWNQNPQGNQRNQNPQGKQRNQNPQGNQWNNEQGNCVNCNYQNCGGTCPNCPLQNNDASSAATQNNTEVPAETTP